jgi:ribosomal protein L10
MSVAETKAARKQSFFGKLLKLLDEYNKVFIVGADNVGSSHLQKIRVALRGKGVILMGKNVTQMAISFLTQPIDHDPKGYQRTS